MAALAQAVDARDILELERRRVVGDLCSRFFDRAGQPLDTTSPAGLGRRQERPIKAICPRLRPRDEA